MNPTTIRALHVRALDIPLIEPFAIATGAQPIAQNVLVGVEINDGSIGWGEAAPFPAVTGETQAQTLTALEHLRPAIVGQDVQRRRAIIAAMRALEPKAAAAQCAVEMAVLDALTKRLGIPLWSFFGGAGTELDTDMTITAGTVAHAATSAHAIVARGIHTIKIKIGGEPGIDLERIAAIHAAAPAAPLILDGNCGYDAPGALRLLAALHERGIAIALFEQPTARHDWDGLARVTREGGVPVAADEAVTTAADALEAVRRGAGTCVNIKLMKCGIAEAFNIASVCRAAGLNLMIGGMVESILAMTVSAHFAAGLGGFGFVDLDTPMFMAEQPFTGGFAQTGGRLSVAHVAGGHGVTPLDAISKQT